jgi:chromosome segregation ATPase
VLIILVTRVAGSTRESEKERTMTGESLEAAGAAETAVDLLQQGVVLEQLEQDYTQMCNQYDQAQLQLASAQQAVVSLQKQLSEKTTASVQESAWQAELQSVKQELKLMQDKYNQDLERQDRVQRENDSLRQEIRYDLLHGGIFSRDPPG